jgi:hypothetical protein
VGADWTPLDDFAENFEDDFVENFEDNPFHSVDDLLVPSHIDDIDDAISSGQRLAVVDQIGAEIAPFRKRVPSTKTTPFRSMLGRANARGMSALEETMDLMADISHGGRASNTTGAIADFIPQTISNLKPVVQNIKNHSTSTMIIDSMKVAQDTVANMSNKKRAAIGIGSLAATLAAIGAASNRNLKERRG